MTKNVFFLSIDKQLSSLPFCWLMWLLENHTAHTCHRISQLFQLRFTILSRVSLSLTHTHTHAHASHTRKEQQLLSRKVKRGTNHQKAVGQVSDRTTNWQAE